MLCTTTTTESSGRWRRESHIHRTSVWFKDDCWYHSKIAPGSNNPWARYLPSEAQKPLKCNGETARDVMIGQPEAAFGKISRAAPDDRKTPVDLDLVDNRGSVAADEHEFG